MNSTYKEIANMRKYVGENGKFMEIEINEEIIEEAPKNYYRLYSILEVALASNKLLESTGGK